jgi:hypothetical protein
MKRWEFLKGGGGARSTSLLYRCYIYFKPNGVPHSLTGPIMYSLTHSKSFFDDGVHGCSDLKLPNPNIGYALYRSTVR